MVKYLLMLLASGLLLAALFWALLFFAGPDKTPTQPVPSSPTGTLAQPRQTGEGLPSQPTGSESGPISTPGQASEAAPVRLSLPPQPVEPTAEKSPSQPPLTTTQPVQVDPETIIVQPAGTKSWQEMEDASESEPPQQPTAIHVPLAPSPQEINPNGE